MEAGLGCAILARSTVGSDLLKSGIHARRIVEPSLIRELSLISLSEQPQTRALIEVRQIVRRAVLQDVKNGRWPAEIVEQARKRSGKGRQRARLDSRPHYWGSVLVSIKQTHGA
ncbi:MULTISPECIES: hypothetical protein [unclassified Bradyrhizobium]|uniref:hypothetical protein n=1 Tax=unclassified Bradyrhizobium TaxID=2631580 RepID=UPI0039656D5A